VQRLLQRVKVAAIFSRNQMAPLLSMVKYRFSTVSPSGCRTTTPRRLQPALFQPLRFQPSKQILGR
jgi:hypothetical protein